MKFVLLFFAVLLFIGVIVSFALTRDGALVTPEGNGEVVLGSGAFEAFPLPDYAANLLPEGYKSYLVEVEPGIKVHVLEVGSGYPVYMQHGNPTSGLLYRKVVDALPTDQVRVVMPTLVGLGFSTKVPSSMHTLDNHVRWTNSAIQHLALEELVFVGQDWGGPIGLGALSMSPDLLQGTVILNTTVMDVTTKTELSRTHSLVKYPLIGELFVDVLLPRLNLLSNVQGDPASFSAEVASLYDRPLQESGNKKAPLALMRMVPDGPDHPSAEGMKPITVYLEGLDVPAEIVWGMNDPILGAHLPIMSGYFPEAPILETPAGHFLQEEVPADIADAVMRIVAKVKEAEVSQSEDGAALETDRPAGEGVPSMDEQL